MFGCEYLAVHARTVDDSDIFAQATSLAQVRVLEVSSWILRELSLRRQAPALSESHLAQARRSRLSERT